MADEPTPKDTTKAAAPKADKAKAAAAKPAKEKALKLEDKPFSEFIEQHYLPGLKQALEAEGLTNLALTFEKTKFTVVGAPDSDTCWQVIGRWKAGKRQFNIAFLTEDINGPKVFACADNGAVPSTIEQFMGDERKVTLDLLLLYTLQRLNGQKWLTRN
jgi:hypothetical protein